MKIEFTRREFDAAIPLIEAFINRFYEDNETAQAFAAGIHNNGYQWLVFLGKEFEIEGLEVDVNAERVIFIYNENDVVNVHEVFSKEAVAICDMLGCLRSVVRASMRIFKNLSSNLIAISVKKKVDTKEDPKLIDEFLGVVDLAGHGEYVWYKSSKRPLFDIDPRILNNLVTDDRFKAYHIEVLGVGDPRGGIMPSNDYLQIWVTRRTS